MQATYTRLKLACYTTNLTMAVIANLSPLLFLTFRSLYGISYASLGLLVTINFCTQLLIDLAFSFFSHKFPLTFTVKITPVISAAGLLFYALSPVLFPHSVYTGLAIGTVLFAASGGLAEVLMSPVIAAIPAENPDKEMSKLHAVYAWGVVFVVIISTVFLLLLGRENWQWLALLWLAVPILSAVLFSRAKVPELRLQEGQGASGTARLLLNKGFLLCLMCIFLGGASENIMSQWSSSYLEKALQIPKVWGDVCGVAMFGVMLGLGRSLYAKFGKNINRVLFLGSLSATVCYLTAAVSNIPFLGLVACALTGFCTSMLWPGNLIVGANRFPSGGVVLYALMAAGGDLGGSIGPQFVGVITDAAAKSTHISAWAVRHGLSMEQAGMKIGILFAVLFPALLSMLTFISLRYEKRRTARLSR